MLAPIAKGFINHGRAVTMALAACAQYTAWWRVGIGASANLRLWPGRSQHCVESVFAPAWGQAWCLNEGSHMSASQRSRKQRSLLQAGCGFVCEQLQI